MKKLHIILLALAIAFSTGLVTEQMNVRAAAVINAPSAPQAQYISVNPLTVVYNPGRYLHRNIKITGKFDKFSTLGLDYAPAMRSSEKYITFLIQRPDVTNHDIPLSELKIFLKKDVAEKHIDLDAGDMVEFTGKIFSTALGDAWMDVDEFKVLNKVKSAKSGN